MTTEIIKANTAADTTDAADVPAAFTPATARRLATAERILYGTAGIAATIGPQLGNGWLHGSAALVGAGTIAHLWARTRSDDHGRLLTSAYRALPALGLSGAYMAALIAPGAAWWEYAAPVGAAVLSAVAVPWTRSRGVRRAAANLPAIVDAGAPRDQETGDPYTDGLRELWAASSQTGETRLTGIRQYSPHRPDFEAVIVAPPGEAVPHGLTQARTLAAVFDVPEGAITTKAVPQRGPGYLGVRVAPVAHQEEQEKAPDVGDTLAALWEAKVSGPTGVAPGAVLVDHRVQDDRIVIRVEAAEDKLISLPRLPLARALGVEDPELLMIETDGIAGAVITLYREHPLLNVREATVEDLTMDASGRIAVGLRHDGRPARWPLYEPELGALTDLLVGAPGSGKSVTLLTLIAAERINGIVSIVADAQDGMSLPEVQGRAYHFGAGQAASAATLAATCAVATYREKVSAANGWGSFVMGKPWKLLILTMDEINRMIAADAGVPEPFRKWVAGMLGRGQITWRKVGAGVRYAGQSIHLTDLGGSEKIRANAKNGSVWLGRVNSSMTRTMASDMASGAAGSITPIPKFFGVTGAAELDAAWTGAEAPTGPVTAGTAWLIQSGQPYLSRVWRSVKRDRSYPGLIALMESAPVPVLSPEEDEVFRRAYAEALLHAEALLLGEEGLREYAEALLHADGPVQADGVTVDRTEASGFPAPPAPVLTVAERIFDVLAAHPEGLHLRDIRAALGCGSGGPSTGTVNNTASQLAKEGRLVARSGIYRLPASD